MFFVFIDLVVEEEEGGSSSCSTIGSFNKFTLFNLFFHVYVRSSCVLCKGKEGLEGFFQNTITEGSKDREIKIDIEAIYWPKNTSVWLA